MEKKDMERTKKDSKIELRINSVAKSQLQRKAKESGVTLTALILRALKIDYSHNVDGK